MSTGLICRAACVATAGCLLQTGARAAPGPGQSVASPPGTGRTVQTFRFERPAVVARDGATHIRLADCPPDVIPGAPALPVFGVTLPVPEGRRARTIRITPAQTTSLDLPHPVACAQEAIPLSADPRGRKPTPADARIYARHGPYPDYGAGEQMRPRRDTLHGDDLLTLALHPVQVVPARHQLLMHGELTVSVDWEPIPHDQAARPWRPRRKLPPKEADRARSLSLLPNVSGDAAPPTLTEATPADVPVVHSTTWPLSGNIDHVIIATSNALTQTPAPWNLEALSTARRAAGLTSTQVGVEWIDATYAGRDQAERIRAFIRDAYDNWSTRFVLLVGSAAQVATRKLYCSFSVATDLIPADGVYYGCLDGTFDADNDGVFGEIGDGDNGGDVDLVAEVFVGRLPAVTTADVASMVRKTLAYEALPAHALGRISHLGEHLGFGGETEYATGSMEQIRLGASSGGFTSIGFANAALRKAFDTTDTLYDSPDPYYRWAAADMFARLNQNFHVFNHLGHGSVTSGMKINLYYTYNRTALATLTNAQPYFIYSQACDVGAFDLNAECFAKQMLASSGGAFGSVMNTRYGFGYANNVNGPSQLFHRKFWDGVFSGSTYHLGEMNARSRENLRYLLSAYAGNVHRWTYYELSLFGDPATPFAAPLLNLAPAIAHTGLQNSHDTSSDHGIVAEIGPPSLVDPATPRVIWHTSADPVGVLRTNRLMHQSGLSFAAALPAQPLGTTIFYTLQAETRAGVTAQWPDTGEHDFSITFPLSLVVSGSPAAYGQATPPYGTHCIASGIVVQASVPERVVVSDDCSQTCLGSTGSGSVTADPSPTNTFLLLTDSQLNWHWIDAYRVQQTATIPALPTTASWRNRGEVVASDPAPPVMQHNGIEHRFTGWWMNGARQPSDDTRAVNPLTSVTITEPVTFEARYLPASQDSDDNGMADWWEIFYLGGIGRAPPDADDDGDGFTTLEEFGDRTDPTLATSFPAPPSIRHAHLAVIQTNPPPYAIEAMIADTHAIAQARLYWNRNDGPWQTTELADQGLNRFTGSLPLPGTCGDRIAYLLYATDPSGQTAMAGPYTLDLVYPQATLSPTPDLNLLLSRHTQTRTSLVVTNTGNAPLVWQLHPEVFEPVTPAATNEWDLQAYKQGWQLSTNRTRSPPLALRGAPRSLGSYTAPSVYAGLRSPRVIPAEGSSLTFDYWIASELDSAHPGFAYDGVIVEVSTNQGMSYTQLPGPYTHKFTGWTYSPWPQNTPCFAGNGSEGWRTAAFDLSAYAGQSIFVRWVYGGDNNTDGEGIYLDDLAFNNLSPLNWPAWLTPIIFEGTNEPGIHTEIALDIDTAGSPRRDLAQRVTVASNAPEQPRLHTDVSIAVRAIPWVGAPTALQTSTNGEGTVTLAAPVAEADGEPLAVHIQFAAGSATNWSLPLLFNAATALGSPSPGTSQSTIREVPTRADGIPATNTLTVRWDTLATLPALPPLSPGVRLRLCASNAWFGSDWMETPPFLVDNEPPGPPTTLQSTTHAPSVWTRDDAFTATWNAAGDGSGIGGVGYRFRLSPDPDDALDGLSAFTRETRSTLAAPDGSSLWFAVRAADAYGNVSPIARCGPYRIDTTPPLTSGASVHIARSPFGNYVVGDLLDAGWQGFADPLSGILAYQVLHQSPSAFTPIVMTSRTRLCVPVTPDDAIHRVWVYAVDRAGNCSPMIADAVQVLTRLGDQDGDGYTAADEERAGTDATDANAVLRLFTLPPTLAGEHVGIGWLGLSGRTYTLLRTDALVPAPDWQPVPGFNRIPGTGTWMTHVPGTVAPAGFYKLIVE